MVWVFIAGLAMLVLGAELLVRGASRLALSLGISPLVVGLTVVAFGTSAPEMAVSVGAVLKGRTDMAIGNVVGSNIFNVLLILGLSAVITPLLVNAQIIRQEVPIMIGASVLLLVLGLDGRISAVDAALLLALLIAYTLFLIIQSRRESKEIQDEFQAEIETKSQWDAHWSVQLGLIVAGLGLLVLGSDWLVEAASSFARALGLSDLVIALTIVAAGTSMPELATSIMAAVRKERDIAVGNVIGSCTFNLLGCVGLAGLAASDGLGMAPALLAFDIWVMLAVSLACLPIFVTGREIARWEGAVFLGYYVAYTAYLILAAQQHDALQAFSATMLGFVVPLTVVTLVVTLLNPKRKLAG
ncbi:calcium/sodium antiporter [Rhodoferax sp.]|uniref:calcium/sodium antiporter n=1 Tax=Rhodoferax sp. TaxID=50421 RepID=UPI0027160D15|nr:calcium/sodium antiporter [Rhodoferax sp.]MDO9195820.1 calcium/sodium antiporter [Rhodoferax sp.]